MRESRKVTGHPSLSPVPLLRRLHWVHCFLRQKTNDPQIPTPDSSLNLVGLPRSGRPRCLYRKHIRKPNSSLQKVTLTSPFLPSSPETGELQVTGFPESFSWVTWLSCFSLTPGRKTGGEMDELSCTQTVTPRCWILSWMLWVSVFAQCVHPNGSTLRQQHPERETAHSGV